MFLGALILVQFAPILFTGRSYFLGDLTYYYHPWHVLSAEQVQRGMLPLWNPYAYMGFPLHAVMQTGTFGPGTLPFYLFHFPWAHKLHLVLHHGLAAFFAYAWLRRLGRGPATLAAAVFGLNGFSVNSVGITNWTATLAWWPAFFLFAGRPVLLGLALGSSLLMGYPPIWTAIALGALILPWGWPLPFVRRGGTAAPAKPGAARRRSPPVKIIAPLALGASLAACLILPGLELIAHSTRKSGVSFEERTLVSLRPRDLGGFVSPGFIEAPASPGFKHPFPKTYYVGFVASGLAILGFLSLRSGKVWITAYLAGCLLVLMGDDNPVSAFLWRTVLPLRYVRAPAHLAYLPLAAIAPLAALGARKAPWLALAAGLELLAYGRGIQATIPDRYFTDPGPLVERFRKDLGHHRFAASPLAARLLEGRGRGAEERYFDVKHRLYGLTHLPYHLHAVAGLGESMLLAETDKVIDFLYTRQGAKEALPYLAWLDAKYLLTKEAAPDLPSEAVLWPMTEVPSPARAWWIPESAGPLLSGGLESAARVQGARPLSYTEPREDRFEVSGQAPSRGWIFVSNARYPGWRVRPPAEIAPALGAFLRVPAEAGEISLKFFYKPNSLRIGLLLTLAGLAAAGAWGCSRLRTS